MRYYAHFGHREFVLALGHGGAVIREYVERELAHEGWAITLADTGTAASIGERLGRVRPHVGDDAIFLGNYADGLTDLHLPDLIQAFVASDKVAACVCIRPALSYHFVRTQADGTVVQLDEGREVDLLINGGYFVFRQGIFEYLRDGEDLVGDAFRRLIADRQLLGYRYDGFWRNVDTFKDKQALEDLAANEAAPWEVWSGRIAAREG
jgi:glucose-1-phosphate cytidylyltransferase